MREDGRGARGSASPTNLHWHDGSTCHGSPSLQDCAKQAIANGWLGKILETSDNYADGTEVKCYSLIASSFDHWAKHGTYVATIKLTMERIR